MLSNDQCSYTNDTRRKLMWNSKSAKQSNLVFSLIIVSLLFLILGHYENLMRTGSVEGSMVCDISRSGASWLGI